MSQWTFTWVSRTRIFDCRTSQISLISGTFLRSPAWKGIVFFQTLTWGTVSCCLKVRLFNSQCQKFLGGELDVRIWRMEWCVSRHVSKPFWTCSLWHDVELTFHESRSAFFVHWWFCPWKSISTFANLFSEVSKGAPSKLNWEVGPRGILHDLRMNTVLETGLD